MRELSTAAVTHPLVDFGGESFVATESRSPVIFLTAGRVSLLAAAAAADRRVVLVTDELCLLTPAFVEVWREAGAAWVVRSPGGLREGFSGRRLSEIGEVFTVAGVRSVDDIDLGFLRPTPATAVEILVVVSLRHRARSSTLLGGPIATLSELLTGQSPAVWGAHEPAGNRWDREQLTTFARAQMPGPTLLVSSGERFRSSLVIQRTDHGLEEITEAHISLGVPSTVSFEEKRAQLEAFLAQLATTGMPLVGLVFARPGRDDLLTPAFLQQPPSPLALLIGPPGVRGLEIATEQMVQDFGAVTVGRPRIPGLLFPLGSLEDPTWSRLDAILAAIGRDRVGEVLGLSRRHTTAETGRSSGGGDGE
jgi:hypothetical protein